jgi:hypothetical protein
MRGSGLSWEFTVGEASNRDHPATSAKTLFSDLEQIDHRTTVCKSLMGVYLTGVHLMGIHFMGMRLISIRLIGVCLMGVHLTGVHVIREELKNSCEAILSPCADLGCLWIFKRRAGGV